MALIRSSRYPGRWTAPNAGHPQGAFKNRTAPGALDGSYIEQDWANDWDGFFSSLLGAASITANGNVDAVGASQYYTALTTIIPLIASTQFIAKTNGPTVKGLFSNLKAGSTGLSAVVTITADEIVLKSSTNEYVTVRNVSVTPSFANAAGANGMDVGAAGTQTASTWYYPWVIYNPTTTTVAGILSLSATAPTLPSGYTFAARASAVRTDATANKFPLSFLQVGKQVRYVVAAGSNFAASAVMASGILGSVTTPTWSAVNVDPFIPPTSSIIDFGTGTLAQGLVYMVADTNSYGAFSSTTNPPPILQNTANPGADFIRFASRLFVGASRNIFCASSASDFNLRIIGWEDNL